MAMAGGSRVGSSLSGLLESDRAERDRFWVQHLPEPPMRELDVESTVRILNRIMEYELAGVVRNTHHR